MAEVGDPETGRSPVASRGQMTQASEEQIAALREGDPPRDDRPTGDR
jgi:hypothetical protein